MVCHSISYHLPCFMTYFWELYFKSRKYYNSINNQKSHFSIYYTPIFTLSPKLKPYHLICLILHSMAAKHPNKKKSRIHKNEPCISKLNLHQGQHIHNSILPYDIEWMFTQRLVYIFVISWHYWKKTFNHQSLLFSNFSLILKLDSSQRHWEQDMNKYLYKLINTIWIMKEISLICGKQLGVK